MTHVKRSRLALAVLAAIGWLIASDGLAQVKGGVQPLIATCGTKPNDCYTYQCTDGGWVETGNKPNGTACNDHNACTTGDACSSGVCVGTPLAGINDNNACTADSCNTTTGVITHTPLTGTACNDNNACTQTDTCQAGVCVGTNPKVCPVTDAQCQNPGTCNPSTGTCSAATNKANGTSCDKDGSACTADTCQGGACTLASPKTCALPDQCHMAGTCNPADGVCVYPSKLDGTSCDDGQTCTTGDACSSGSCVGTPVQEGPCCRAGSSVPNDSCCVNGVPLPASSEACTYVCYDDLGRMTQRAVCVSGSPCNATCP